MHLWSPVVDTSRSPHARLKPAPVSAVRLSDSFWEPRRRINREVTIPSQYRHCEETGRIDNFLRASGKKKDVPFQGIFFNDSDVYKWLEAAAWTLASERDAAIERMVEDTITEVADAQQPDGYLNTYFMFDLAGERFTNLRDKHELYCAGHLIQAAVAHHRATGSERLLDVARRYADLICERFGPKEEGKLYLTDGHEEIEMALIELARASGDEKYLRQAQFLLDARGQGTIGGSEYHQDHKPIREMDRVTGHAVRQVYLNAGIADLLAETGEPALRAALERMWANMTTRQMYVSGGIGSRHEGEAFGRDYELPNERAYTETCAAIGSVMWAWRMLQLEGDARYADVMELALYNGFLSGVSLDGQSYFYENPLSDDGTHRRQPWFGCACCPPNVARVLASLPGYFYSVTDDSVYVHLYAEGPAAGLTLADGRLMQLDVHTRYPWDGEIAIEVGTATTCTVHFRIPAWCETGATLEVNGERVEGDLTPGSYVAVHRVWNSGDSIHLSLPMPVRRIECHPYAAENRDRVALKRGPLLYCVEQVDNPDVDVRDLVLPANADMTPVWRDDLLGGVMALRGMGGVHPPDAEWEGHLYRAQRERPDSPARPTQITAVPYYAWANRDPGRMEVWLRTR